MSIIKKIYHSVIEKWIEINEKYLHSSSSSVSDDGVYPKLVKAAVNSSKVFCDFRRKHIYIKIVEARTPDNSQKCLDILEEKDIYNWNQIEKFKDNDLIGNPILDEFVYAERKFWMSSKTVQYMYEAFSIMEHIPSIKEEPYSIIEIGVGYGGLFRILTQCIPIKRYTFVDLPEVLELTEKYLSHFDIDKSINIEYKTVGDSFEDYDLVISNYAFSELNPDLQYYYKENILDKSKHGYMKYNVCSEKKYSKKNPIRIVNMLYYYPKLQVERINPLVSRNNCLLFW